MFEQRSFAASLRQQRGPVCGEGSHSVARSLGGSTVTLTTRYSLAFVLLVTSLAYGQSKPSPLLADGQPVDWWFVFKFNAESFPACGGSAQRACLFGGTVQKYKNFGQQFAFASSQEIGRAACRVSDWSSDVCSSDLMPSLSPRAEVPLNGHACSAGPYKNTRISANSSLLPAARRSEEPRVG